MVNYNLPDSSAFTAGVHDRTGSHNDDYYIYHMQVNITGEYNETGFHNGTNYFDYAYIFSIFAMLSCIFGMLGNGMVIWLLVFCIKRNHFTTYILNLAIADSGFLTTTVVFGMAYFSPQMFLPMNFILAFLFESIYYSTFNTSQFLLTAIAMDRCVSVLFPLWHRCHRPPYLSAIACTLIWLLSFLPYAITLAISVKASSPYYDATMYLFIVNGFICLPLMSISSLMLFTKVCCKSKQQRRGKLLITILVTISFFWFLCFPFNAFTMIYYLFNGELIFLDSSIFCACLNSSVNPLIYYLVGRPRKGRPNKSMKAILQKLFKEEEI